MTQSSIEKASTATSDDVLLMSIGKEAKLKRVFNFWTLCAYQIMYLGSWSCFIVLYSTIFDLGGPVGLLYGTLAVTVGQMLLMMSLAEYCTIWPVAGGQQYYVQAVSTPRIRPIMSYICSAFGAFVGTTYPNVDWQPWMTWLTYSAFLMTPFAVNLRHSWLPGLNIVGTFWTIAGGIVWAIVFCVMAEPKADAKFIFTQWMNNSGYTSNFWVFVMALYNPMYAFYGTDGILHLAEETKDAAKTVPRAMVWSMAFCGVSSLLTCLVLLWTSAKWSSYVEGDQPYLDWFIDITRSVYGGGVFCCLLIVGLNFFCCVATNTAASRLIWSMARDMTFPWSTYFAYISARFGIPLRSMIAILVVDLLIGLIVLGSDLAFESIISAGGATLQIGYVAPIIIVLCRGRKILPPRPHFDLGRWGYPVNIISVCWSLLITIMFLCPLYVPVTVDTIDNMNWSILIVGATVLFSGLYWVFRGRVRDPTESNPVLDDPVVVNGFAPAQAASGSGGTIQIKTGAKP